MYQIHILYFLQATYAFKGEMDIYFKIIMNLYHLCKVDKQRLVQKQREVIHCHQSMKHLLSNYT